MASRSGTSKAAKDFKDNVRMAVTGGKSGINSPKLQSVYKKRQNDTTPRGGTKDGAARRDDTYEKIRREFYRTN